MLCPHPTHVPGRPRHGVHGARPGVPPGRRRGRQGRRASRRAAPRQPTPSCRRRSRHLDFLSGGYSHVETFDPKPALTQHAGKTFDKTPFENPILSPLHRKRFRSVPAEEINVRDVYPSIYPMQVGFRKAGQAGIEISDWWPHLSTCVDDLCFVRNMWTT
ncbi:MAG: DUF1501 domain-containing protein, partial [Singulisphaera sp.]